MVPPDWEDCLLYKIKQGDLWNVTVFFWIKSTQKGGKQTVCLKYK